ncbi:hypothetical protein TWF694_001850 [Orbilia ellipsospora]|uniref:Peptidase S8/S53 domain-containing protein n=1 Tax=Orbilia ellipsospora TaxID=2528407 RepID=A0AAV9X3R6_9PEZI
MRKIFLTLYYLISLTLLANVTIAFDQTLNKKAGFGYKPDDVIPVCIVINAKNRKDQTWLKSLDDRTNSLKEKNGEYEYTSSSSIYGRVFQCFTATYNNFLEVLRSHQDGLQGYGDYNKVLNGDKSLPVIYDNDKYDSAVKKPDGSQATLNKNKRRKKKRKRSLHSPIKYHFNPQKPARSFVKRQDAPKSSKLNSELVKRATTDPNAGLRRCTSCPWDMGVLSDPPPGSGSPPDYIFDENDGDGAFVYIIDSGLDLKQTQFQWKDPNKDIGWIFAGPDPPTDKKDYSATPISGTSAAAKIIGHDTGYARKTFAYMVVPYDSKGHLNMMTYLDALLKMHEQIKTAPNSNKRKIVICFSHKQFLLARGNEMFNWPEFKSVSDSKKHFIDAVTEALDDILVDFSKMENIVMVTRATGLKLAQYPVDPILGWPSRRATTNITNLVMVGGVDINGVKVMQAPGWVNVFGLAEEVREQGTITGAKESKDFSTVHNSISIAVASISGLLAFFMAKYNESGVQARWRLEAYAYPRVPNGYRVAWNGLRVNSCAYDPTIKDLAPPDSEPSGKPNPKLVRRRASDPSKYDPGEPISCVPIEFTAEIIQPAKGDNKSEPTIRYVRNQVSATVTIPDAATPKIPRPTYYTTYTSYINQGSGGGAPKPAFEKQHLKPGETGNGILTVYVYTSMPDGSNSTSTVAPVNDGGVMTADTSIFTSALLSSNANGSTSSALSTPILAPTMAASTTATEGYAPSTRSHEQTSMQTVTTASTANKSLSTFLSSKSA